MISEEQKKKYEESDVFIQYVKSLIEEGERKGWNEAIGMLQRMIMDESAVDYITTGKIIDDLQKLRK